MHDAWREYVYRQGQPAPAYWDDLPEAEQVAWNTLANDIQAIADTPEVETTARRWPHA